MDTPTHIEKVDTPIHSAKMDNHKSEGKIESTNSMEKITLNLSGVRFTVSKKLFHKYPDSLLGNAEDLSLYYDAGEDEYFFDRCPVMFPAILDFYREDEIHLPKSTCRRRFKKEMDFWGIDEKEIPQCCWLEYMEEIGKFEDLDAFAAANPKPDPTLYEFKGEGKFARIRHKVWMFLDEPYSSLPAKVYGVASTIVLIVALLVLCLETMSSLQVSLTRQEMIEALDIKHKQDHEINDILSNYHYKDWEIHEPNSTKNATQRKDSGMTKPAEALLMLDFLCITFFTIEIIVRFIFSPSKLRFLINKYTIFDVLSILPFYIEYLIITEYMPSEKYTNSDIDAIYALKVFRVFRVFRLGRHNRNISVLMYTIVHSFKDIIIMLVFLILGMLLFSVLIYYAEDDAVFDSIPKSLWWAIVTMTTVGYGDMVPKSYIGYCVGTGAALSGVLLIAFTVPVIVNNFLLFDAFSRIESRDITTESTTNSKAKVAPLPDTATTDICTVSDGTSTFTQNEKV